MKKLITCAAALAATVCSAATWWVDDDSYGKSGMDGSEAKPFGTIQEAVNAAAKAGGDTIKVLPGTYDKGSTVDTCANGGHNNRVLVDRSLTIESVGGKAVTHIVGAKDPSAPEAQFGMGANAVRCILVTDGSLTVTIKGFTIRDGACGYTTNSDNLLHWGGGVAVNTTAAQPGGTYLTSLVDCTVKNCVGTRGGGTRKAAAFRTLYTACRATGNGGCARDGVFGHCVFFSNIRPSCVADGLVVNCTFAGLYSGSALQSGASGCQAYNSYFSYCSAATGSDSLYRCVLNSTTSGKQNDACKGDSNWAQVISPATGDFRPIADGHLDGTANRDYLAKIPAAYRLVDFNGNAIADSGTLNVGAVQETATPAGGKILLAGLLSVAAPTDKCLAVTVDGYEEIINSEMHAYPTVWPTQYLVRVASDATHRMMSLYRNLFDNCHFPDMNGDFYVMPPDAVSSILTLTPRYADKVLYVDPTPGKGDDANAGTEAAPFRTLQKAASAADTSKNTLVLCAAGTYEEGGAFAGGVTNRLVVPRNMHFRGAGAGRSVIRGAADPAGVTHDGCGSAAVRCVCVTEGASAIQGFTLVDGHTTIGGNDQSVTKMGDSDGVRGGGAYFSGTTSCLMDCVVTNCVASRGAAAFGGRLIRCHFTGNTVMANSGGNSIIRNCQATCCTLFDNTDRYSDLLGQQASYYNCSLVHKAGNSINAQGGIAYNCLSTTAFTEKYAVGCVSGSANCQYRDASVGDMRITTASKAIGGGVTAGVPNLVNYADSSIDNCRLRFVNGRPVCGAYQNPLRVIDVASSLSGDTGSVSPSGKAYLAEGESLTVTVTPVATRLYLGIARDGELLEGATSVTVAGADYPFDVDRTHLVRAVYSPDWYVDAAADDDSGNGFTPETAKRTLAGVFAADVRAGDTVHAAAGEYAEGTMLQTTSIYSLPDADPTSRIPARVVLPAGVSLVGVGADKTAIVGARDTTASGDQYGRGPNAVRCAVLYENTTIRGFTLRDGAVDSLGTASDNTIGGGVLTKSRGEQATSRVIDCVIANCVAGRGGAAFGGLFVTCRFLGNWGINNGSVRDASAYNCYFSGNRSGGAIHDYLYRAVNCTFAADNLNLSGTGTTSPCANPYDQSYYVANCLFLAKSGFSNVGCVYNCRFPKGVKIVGAKEDVGNVACEPAEFVVDSDNVPVVGANLAVDAADAAYFPSDVLTDCAGNQRVWNGRLDVGCFEADWRPKYARDLGSRLTVEVADPSVTETPAGAVAIPADAAFAFTARNASGRSVRQSVGARVTGTGTLTVLLNGDVLGTVTAADGDKRLVFDNALDVNWLTFAYAAEDDDTGCAELLAFKRDTGLSVVIR